MSQVKIIDGKVEPESFLQGRERAYEGGIMGRKAGDAEKLFPKFTHASPATLKEVTVNGKVLPIWTWAQLEALSVAVLRQRAMAIRDALGEAACPALPSAHHMDLARWIMHMQEQLVEAPPQPARAGGYGAGYTAPAAFFRESKDRPIAERRSPSPRVEKKLQHEVGEVEAMKDHMDAMFGTSPEAIREAARASPPRTGGRRYLDHRSNMQNCGVSVSDTTGVTQLRGGGEGRRHLRAQDHLFEQRKEAEEGGATGDQPKSPRRTDYSPRCAPRTVQAGLSGLGPLGPDPDKEIPVGGRRHLRQEDSMLAPGVSTIVEDRPNRRVIDHFTGAKTNFADSHPSYQATWKKDPSRLLGNSQII